jgi:hypothetical protein
MMEPVMQAVRLAQYESGTRDIKHVRKLSAKRRREPKRRKRYCTEEALLDSPAMSRPSSVQIGQLRASRGCTNRLILQIACPDWLARIGFQIAEEVQVDYSPSAAMVLETAMLLRNAAALDHRHGQVLLCTPSRQPLPIEKIASGLFDIP